MAKKYPYHRMRVNGRLIDEHRLVMEKHLGRKLSSNEVVHHIDGDKTNNDIDNLQVMTRQEHALLHEARGDLHRPPDNGRRFEKGNRPPNRKLSDESALDIFDMIKSGVPNKEIMLQYGIKRSVLSDIMRGKSYSAVTGIGISCSDAKHENG